MAFKTPIGEEGKAVAFHPSGFHILVAVSDKIMMMNVLSNSIQEYHSIALKNCREIRFSNGGQKFAAGVSSYTYIYDFYSADCPSNMQCKGHSGKIVNIDWFEDDSGISDGCNAGRACFYDLQIQRVTGSRLTAFDFHKANSQILGIVNVPDDPNRAILATS